jgi:hypothetical protein
LKSLAAFCGGILFTFAFFQSPSTTSSENTAGLSWPSWAGGTYVSSDCECNDNYQDPSGGQVYWEVCKTKNLWGLNTTGYAAPTIDSGPCP